MFSGASSAVQNENIHVTHWSLDETSLGAYSVASPTNWDDRVALGEPEPPMGKPRLFFAGEAITVPKDKGKYNGSYAGAFESGKAAADQINKALDRKTR